MTSGLWKLPEPWTPQTAPTAPWKTTEQVFHSSHRSSSSCSSDSETESVNLSTKPGQPHLNVLAIAVVVLRARTNRLSDLRPLAPSLLAALPHVKRGEATVVGP